MNKDYNYKKYPKILNELESNGFQKVSESRVLDGIVHSYEMWVGGGHNIIIEKYRDGYSAIYVDAENLPKIKKANKTKNGNTNN